MLWATGHACLEAWDVLPAALEAGRSGQARADVELDGPGGSGMMVVMRRFGGSEAAEGLDVGARSNRQRVLDLLRAGEVSMRHKYLLAALVMGLFGHVPLASAADQCGGASWYGPGFHGKKTASGQKFNENAMTAAHKTLPLGTVVGATSHDGLHHARLAFLGFGVVILHACPSGPQRLPDSSR